MFLRSPYTYTETVTVYTVYIQYTHNTVGALSRPHQVNLGKAKIYILWTSTGDTPTCLIWKYMEVVGHLKARVNQKSLTGIVMIKGSG